MKKCIKCLTEKPLNDFYKNDGNRDGHQGSCIQCIKEKNAEKSALRPKRYKKYDKNVNTED